MKRLLIAAIAVACITALAPNGLASTPNFKGPALWRTASISWSNRATCVKPTKSYIWGVFVKPSLNIDEFRGTMIKPSGTVVQMTATYDLSARVYDVYLTLHSYPGSFFLGGKWRTFAIRNGSVVWRATNAFTKC
jgi:hypothetical protein